MMRHPATLALGLLALALIPARAAAVTYTCTVFLTANQTLTTRVEQVVLFNDAGSTCTAGMFMTNGRVEIPANGFYLIIPQVVWKDDASKGYVRMRLYSNGKQVGRGPHQTWLPRAGQRITANASYVLPLNDGDHLQLKVWRSFSGPVTMLGGTEGDKQTLLVVTKIAGP